MMEDIFLTDPHRPGAGEALQELVGAELDFDTEGQARSLLFDYVAMPTTTLQNTSRKTSRGNLAPAANDGECLCCRWRKKIPVEDGRR